MKIARIAITLALTLGAHSLAAQQPDGMMGSPGMAAHMQAMDSLNARLDTLASRMNRASGSRKVAAMADVINELVAQRRTMQSHMREMMESRGGMMPMMKPPAGSPMPKPDSTPADTAGHAGHHPPS